MFEMLAVIPPQLAIILFLMILTIVLLLIPMLKKSKSVDKLIDGLFKPVETNTIDECIGKIKDGKDGLVQKSKEIAQTIKDKAEEQKKINKNL